jgi:hypothetical protein
MRHISTHDMGLSFRRFLFARRFLPGTAGVRALSMGVLSRFLLPAGLFVAEGGLGPVSE